MGKQSDNQSDQVLITLRLDPDLLKQFDDLAADLGRSRASLLRLLIQQSLELQELKQMSLLDLTADRIADKLLELLGPQLVRGKLI
jgi:predicted transcriptional regulator